MEIKTSLRIGELVYCSCPEGVFDWPKGLPDNALAEVVAHYADKTYVKYSGVTFTLPNDCVHRALPESVGHYIAFASCGDCKQLRAYS